VFFIGEGGGVIANYQPISKEKQRCPGEKVNFSGIERESPEKRRVY
jgi:hypothetical protein